MKKITRNELKNKPVIKVGYCGAYYLLKGLERIGYMSGIYGWNCDVYDAGAVYIVTGYRFYGLRGYYAASYVLDTCEKNAKRIFEAGSKNGADVSEYIAFFRRTFVNTHVALIEADLI